MVSKLMKGRKRYRWKGLTEEQENEMITMLDSLNDSPAKQDLSCSPEVSPKGLKIKLMDPSSEQDAKSCVMLGHENVRSDCMHDNSVTENIKGELMDSVCFVSDTESTNSTVVTPKCKSSQKKTKRRSNAFKPMVNYKDDYSQEHSAVASKEMTIENETKDDCGQNIGSCILALDLENITEPFDDKSTSEFSNSYVATSSFLDASDMFRQVKEADSVLGDLDNVIEKNERASPILSNVSKNQLKLRRVRRSSRICRQVRGGDEKENILDRGSIFTDIDIEVKDKKRGSGIIKYNKILI